MKNYSNTLTRFEKYCSLKNLTLLQATEIEVNEFLSPYTMKKTQGSYLSWLNSFYLWCIKKKLVEDNPTDDFKPHGTKKEHRLMSYVQFKKMINKCKTLTEITMLSFMWYTGVRTTELIQLRIQDIDLVRNTIWVGRTKGSSNYGMRKIGILPDLKATLKKYINFTTEYRIRKEKTHDELFLNRSGNPLKERTLSDTIERVQINGSERFTPHDFRRAFGTNLFNKTMNIRLTSKMLGHASIQTTEGYIIGNGSDDLDQFSKVNLSG